MNDTLKMNGHRLISAESAPRNLPSVQVSEKQRFLAAVNKNSRLQNVLAAVTTPAGELLNVISKSIGKAEAEIEFTERITYRED